MTLLGRASSKVQVLPWMTCSAGLAATGDPYDPDIALALRVFLFTVVVPGTAAVWLPWWLLTRDSAMPTPIAWHAVSLVGLGGALYLACLWVFALVGRGTPGPWDAPRRFVAVGPYAWVRNPMYIAVVMVITGEAWLFLSLPLLLLGVALAIGFHAFVVLYEEPTLRRAFGATYEQYLATVPRWLPRPPRRP